MDSHYYHHDNHLKRHKYVKRARWFGWGVFLAVVLSVVAIVVYLVFFVKAEEPAVTSQPKTSTIADPISIFRSPYFQFQAADSWVEISSEKEDHYIYRSVRDPLVEQDIQITINPSTQDINRARATRAQVIDPDDGSLNPVDGISKPCSSVDKNVQDNDVITINGTSLRCVAGGALFDVLIAEKDGNHLLTLTRPDGTKLPVIIYYRDLRAVPDGRDLERIVGTFEVR